MKINKLITALMLLILGVWSTVQAAAFQGNSDGVFVNPVGGGGMHTTGGGTNAFTWGIPIGFSAPSSMSYSGNSFDVNENGSFVFGTLSFTNGAIAGATGADSVDMGVNLNFTQPAIGTKNFAFTLGLINTSNTSDPNASADIVNFDNTVPSQSFDLNGATFTLEFLGFGSLTGSGFTVQDSFRVLEGGSASVNLVGRITSTPGIIETPIPAALWLFGSGLLGLMRVRKGIKA